MSGVTHARGFRAGAATGGIKASGRPDVALVVADAPCPAAGVFTKSRTAGPAVVLGRALLASARGGIGGVLVQSGNANVATGAQGHADAREMSEHAVAAAGAGGPVLVCSTGVIGVPLPMDAVRRGIDGAAAALAPGRDAGAAAAEAIRTTDQWAKEAAADVGGIRVGGMAKGAGMIRPDLGTMIAVVTTDAAVAPDVLDIALRRAADRSFNRITVDGCTSTSDSLIVLASGASGVRVETADGAFAEALEAVCRDLALQIVRDGEGARRIGRYTVRGARTPDEALRAARHVAEDQLVRTALYGGDPNWGRIIGALGVCGVDVVQDWIRIAIGGVVVCDHGGKADFAQADADAAAQADEVAIEIDLGLGDASETVWGSDLGHEYVSMNAEYTT